MGEGLIEQIILQAPTVAGLAYALWHASKLNARLVDAIIKRENCEDDEEP
jgi:hypothetical protein